MSEMREITVGGTTYRTTIPPKHLRPKTAVRRDPYRVAAVIPGTIVEVLVETGQPVERGTGVVILEAMKMRNAVTATAAGTVKTVHVEPGRLVAKGDPLIDIERG